MSTSTNITIANIFWFGMFFIGIWFFDWGWYTMLVPIAFHWNKRDYGVVECDHE